MLNAGLDEQPEGALGANQIAGVREREPHAAVDRPPCVPPGPVGGGEQEELEQQVERPAREQAFDSGGHYRDPPMRAMRAARDDDDWACPY